MEVKIKEIADIQFGYYGKPSKEGTIPYLQAKHFNEYGQYNPENDTFLQEDEKTLSNILKNDDVLFVAKGFRFFATLYKEEFGKAVASSIFFIIRVDKSKIIPGYLVSVLNLPKNLLHFHQSGAGSSIPSIRKNELADFVINLIPFEQQQQIVNLQELYLKDIALTENLIMEKKKLFQTTISTIIK